MAKIVQSPNQLQNDSNSTVVGTVAYMVMIYLLMKVLN